MALREALEPLTRKMVDDGHGSDGGSLLTLASIAISLKRIADLLTAQEEVYED